MTTRIRASGWLAPVVALTLAALLPVSVSAHAELERAIPQDGSTVTEPVSVVTGRYSEDMTGNSHLDVKDATGATVASGGIDPVDPRRLIARPETPLPDGTYTVESTTISAQDGDLDRTTWTFTVALTPSAEPTASASPSSSPAASSSPETMSSPAASTAGTAAPSASAAASPSAAPSPSGGTGTPASDDSSSVILPIIAALAIVAFAAGFLINRSRGSGPA